MAWRRTETRYGAPARLLHWLTVIALAGQFLVGYLLDIDDSGHGRGRGRGRGGESGRGRGRGGDEDERADLGSLLTDDSLDLIDLHVALGLSIIVLAIARMAWRRFDGLPPWAGSLSPAERAMAHWTERALYALLIAMPTSGIALLASGDDDLVWLHVATHVAFFVALASHLALVGKHLLVDRDGLLRRMT